MRISGHRTGIARRFSDSTTGEGQIVVAVKAYTITHKGGYLYDEDTYYCR